MSLTACRRSIRTWCGYVAVAAVGLGALPIQADEPASRAAAVSSKSVGQQLSEAEQLAYVREKVVPLLQARCGECHGGGPVNKGGLTLTSRESILKGGDSGPAVVPFHADQSLLISAVNYESFEMPPRSRLPQQEVAILKRWVEMGAPWPVGTGEVVPTGVSEAFPMADRRAAHWAWKPIVCPEVPAIEPSSGGLTNVDRFIMSRLRQEGLQPQVEASRRSLIRRLTFDLIGLPPTIEQQQRFFNDPRDTVSAMESLADELLASPHFGERWARHWLDLVRYAETLGHEFDFPLPYAWRYRDYVIRALNADVPYDQFLREHLAGDLLSEPRRHPELNFNESIIGTGFWYLSEDKHAPVDVKGEESARIDNQIDVFSKAFLGLTVACARCHDHKFDAITSADYYALAGFLQSSRRRLEWLDSGEKIEQAVRQMSGCRQELKDRLQRDLETLTATRLTNLFTGVVSAGASPPSEDRSGHPAELKLRALFQQPDVMQVDHPLSLPAELNRLMTGLAAGKDASDEDLRGAIRSWCDRVEQADRVSRAGTELAIADFRHGIPAGWLTYGTAFQMSSVGEAAVSDTFRSASGAAPDVVWHGDGPGLMATRQVSSAVLSPKLRGVLQSPTFELTHPEILVLVAGQGSRLRLVIDGYVMNEFSELLFRGAKQPIETGGEFRWIRLTEDVHRYQGHRCHLEFLDEGDGWFAVREVRFVAQPGDSPPAGPGPSSCNLQLAGRLSQENCQTMAAVGSAWSSEVVRDPQWPEVADRLELLPSRIAADFDRLRKDWMSISAGVPDGEPVLVMCDGSPEDEHLFIRGNHRNPGPVVPRRFLEALSDGSFPATAGSGRLELADRLLADDNPFVARVAVNRIWQHLFGVGLVASADNLGVLGDPPGNPELLDYLADQFRNDGWSTKRLIRALVLTRTYRQSSQRESTAEATDPTNRWLHRAHVRRLEGEVIRDAMLFVSGRLRPDLYGPSVPVHLTASMQGRGRPKADGPLDGDGRRSVYLSVNRNFLSPFMLAFDTPIPATAVGRRSVSNVPAQALILLNNELVNQQAGVWADRLLAEQHASFADLLDRACRQAFCRPATETETTALRAFAESVATELKWPVQDIHRHREILTDVCHVLLNEKEFLFLD